MKPQSADGVIATLGLSPHPEGGYFSEIFRDASAAPRGHGTAIYFLLRLNQVSHWHRIDATEIFHHYCGHPLEIRLWVEGGPEVRHTLGPNLEAGQRPVLVIPPGTWQTARPLRSDAIAADYSLVGCTVTPAFEFEGFELAAPGWAPPSG